MNTIFRSVKFFGKTESMLFGTNKRLSYVTSFTVSIGNYVIKRIYKYKYLGVILDESISWKEHVKYVAAKVSKKVSLLKRIRTSLRVYSTGIIYKSFVLPILDCCSAVWSTCGLINQTKLKKLQIRAANIVYSSAARNKNISSDIILDNLGWEKVELRRNKHICNLVNKCLDGKVPQFFKGYFKRNRDVLITETRQSDKYMNLYLSRRRTKMGKKSFLHTGGVVFSSNSKFV